MRALLADDDDVMRLLLEEWVRAAGHDVESVADGAAAWAAYERLQPEIVLLDWQMPLLGGDEVCRRIRGAERGQECFVMVVTSLGANEALSSVLDAGADDFLTKPVTIDALHARLTIAERRLALDRARRDAEAALAQARWLAGIGETALAVEHEVNNPLTALLGTAALIQEGLVPPDEMAACLTTIVAEARRIADVVRRLSNLENPHTIDYVHGAKMLDLTKD